MKEIIIAKFDLRHIYDPGFIDIIVRHGYNKTSNKFEVNFCGSKGYFSHIMIQCEGIQKDDTNRLWANDIFKKNGGFRKKVLSIIYREDSGIILNLESIKEKRTTFKLSDDLKNKLGYTHSNDPIPQERKVTLNSFMRRCWESSRTNLHYHDFKELFAEKIKNMFNPVKIK